MTILSIWLQEGMKSERVGLQWATLFLAESLLEILIRGLQMCHN